jgi:phage terminase small subunit
VAGLTIKQETFCQKYIETGNASEAYRQAYNSKGKTEVVAPEASRLLATPKVAARVAELREAVTKAHGVTVSSLIAELEEARQVGAKREQAAAMVAATMGKAKLAGIDKDAGEEGAEAQPVKVEVTVTDSRKPSADA